MHGNPSCETAPCQAEEDGHWLTRGWYRMCIFNIKPMNNDDDNDYYYYYYYYYYFLGIIMGRSVKGNI
jgi:hypothetical protein